MIPLEEASSNFDVIRGWLQDAPGCDLKIVTPDGRIEYLDIYYPAFPNTRAFYNEVLYKERLAVMVK